MRYITRGCLLLSLVFTQTSVAQTVEQRLDEHERRLHAIEQALQSMFKLDIPLSRANMSKTEIITFASSSLVSAFAFDFVNYEQQIQNALRNFNSSGEKQFLKMLQETNTLQNVIAKKYVISAIPLRQPVIVQMFIQKGKYTWAVQVPMKIFTQSESAINEQNHIISIKITRESVAEFPKGVAIDSIEIAPMSGP